MSKKRQIPTISEPALIFWLIGIIIVFGFKILFGN